MSARPVVSTWMDEHVPDMKLTEWQRMVVDAMFDRSSRLWCPACVKDLGAQRGRVSRMHSAYRARKGRTW